MGKYYNPQTNIFDFKMKKARAWNWYDKIWKEVNKCPLCDLKDKYIIFEKNGVVLTSNLYPYTDNHLMIVPRRHIEYAKEMTGQEWEAVRGLMYVAKKALRKYFKKKNLWFIYREGSLGEAQKTVGHLHIQVVPYSEGLVDINYTPIKWAPRETSSRIKDVPEYLESKYNKFLTKYGEYNSPENRIVVNAIIKNKSGKYLLVKKDKRKKWESLSGSINSNEKLKHAMRREIREEANISVGSLCQIHVSEKEMNVKFPEGFTKRWKLIFIHYKCNYKAGELKAGDDAKEAKWFSVRELKKVAISEVTKSILKREKII